MGYAAIFKMKIAILHSNISLKDVGLCKIDLNNCSLLHKRLNSSFVIICNLLDQNHTQVVCL